MTVGEAAGGQGMGDPSEMAGSPGSADVRAATPGALEVDSVGAEFPSALEAEPAVAAAIFGDRIDVVRHYLGLLAGAATIRGLVGPREAGRLWTRHVLNCAIAAEPIVEGARVVDIGSGAGLPGIPLALARPDLRVDLVEPLLRRATFLSEVVDELGIGARVRVVRSRAEDAESVAGEADVVTARAVAPLARLAGWAAPLLRVDGTFLALKGESAVVELDRDRAAVERSGIGQLSVRLCGVGVLAEPTVVVTGRRLERDRRRRSVPAGHRR